MIKVFTTGFEGERFLQLDEVNIVTQKMDLYGRPYILFEHKDYPGGGLYATFDGELWLCDLD